MIRQSGSMVRRVLIVVSLALVLSQSFLLGAGAKATLTVMDWRINSTKTMQAYFARLKELYEAEHPDVEVNYIEVSMNMLLDKLLTGVVTGTAPDVTTLSMLWARDLFEEGVILDLTDLVQRTPTHTPDKFIPATQLYNQLNGRIFGATIAMDEAVLYFNLDHFEETGLNTDPYGITSWDEFTVAAKKLVRKGADGRVSRYGYIHNAKIESFNSWLAANGGGFYADRELNTAGFNTDAGRQTAQFLSDLLLVHEVVGGNFASQTTAMSYNNNATPRIFMQTSPDMRFMATSFPKGPSGKGRGTTVWGNMMSIPASCKQVPLAWDYIKLVSSLQGSIEMFEILDYVGSPRLDFYKTPAWRSGYTRYDWMRMIPEIAYIGSVYPFRRSTDLTPIWKEQIEEAVMGRKGIAAALAEAERLYNIVLSK
ncbi:MAG: ABC transporter substrate-binding protein [Limnochordia bacterium]